MLNEPLSYDKTHKAISKLKVNKAVGYDKIPNEVLKQAGIQQLVYALFAYCFNNSLLPSIWLRGIINPIPKGADKDPCVPLNYRGVSLLSCVYKTYSSIINNRLVKYLELLNILVEEQNGFRAKRACAIM
jgi:hypothetical protein